MGGGLHLLLHLLLVFTVREWVKVRDQLENQIKTSAKREKREWISRSSILHFN